MRWQVGNKSKLDNVHNYPVIPILWSGSEQGPGVVYATPDRINAESDARLIAAAPEMLRALQAIDVEARDANKDGDVIIPSNIFDLVQQAITKATK